MHQPMHTPLPCTWEFSMITVNVAIYFLQTGLCRSFPDAQNKGLRLSLLQGMGSAFCFLCDSYDSSENRNQLNHGYLWGRLSSIWWLLRYLSQFVQRQWNNRRAMFTDCVRFLLPPAHGFFLAPLPEVCWMRKAQWKYFYKKFLIQISNSKPICLR